MHSQKNPVKKKYFGLNEAIAAINKIESRKSIEKNQQNQKLGL